MKYCNDCKHFLEKHCKKIEPSNGQTVFVHCCGLTANWTNDMVYGKRYTKIRKCSKERKRWFFGCGKKARNFESKNKVKRWNDMIYE